MIQITDLVKVKLCPYRFYLERMEKQKTPTTQEMYLGKVFHKVAEEAAVREMLACRDLKPGSSSRQIFDILYAEYCRVIRNTILRRKEKLESLGIDYGVLMGELRDYYKEMALKKAVAVKRALEKKEEEIVIGNVEYYIEDEELGLVGRIDRIEIHKGIVVPVEIKTVEKRHPTFAEVLQLSGYALLLGRQKDISVEKGIVEYPSKRVMVDIPEKMKEYVVLLRDHALQILNGEVPEKVRTDQCDRCHFYEKCWE